jgi:hypothetical protein
VNHNIKNIMLKTFWIFIIFLYAVQVQQLDNKCPQKLKLEYSDGRPTTLGINWYINNVENQRMFIRDYQESMKDTIYNDIYFRTENFKKIRDKKYDPEVLAYNILTSVGCEIVVNNEEKYRGFEYKNRKNPDYEYYNGYDNFLKGTIYHEITHYYFYQVALEMQKIRNLKVNEYYTLSIVTYPNTEMLYGAKFIEEGVCEYVVLKFGECNEFKGIHPPQSKLDFLDKDKVFNIQYKYATKFLQEFLDISVKEFGSIKCGLMLLLANRPPNYDEILQPNLYFERLKVNN